MASRRSSDRPVSWSSPVTLSSCQRQASGVTSTTTPARSSTAVCCSAYRGPGRRRAATVARTNGATGATGVRVRAAEFLERGPRARVPLGVVGLLDRIEMAKDRRVHAERRPDQTGVDVNGLRRSRSGRPALPHDTREDPAKGIATPALPDAGQPGMIRQGFVQRAADEPADRGIPLCLTHQSPARDDAEQEAREHQAHGNFGIDAGTTIVGTAAPGDLARQPARIKNVSTLTRTWSSGTRSRSDEAANRPS